MRRSIFRVCVSFLFLAAAAQTTIASDLKTELAAFWPNRAERDKNVWDLYPIAFVAMRLDAAKAPVFEAVEGSRSGAFKVLSSNTFESGFYRSYHRSTPLVGGAAYQVVPSYASDNTYLAVVRDTRSLDFLRGAPDGSVSQVDFKNSTNDMGEHEYEYGVPLYLNYEDERRCRISCLIEPAQVVNLFFIAHGMGNYKLDHPGLSFGPAQFLPLDPDGEIAERFAEGFPADQLENFIVRFAFSDGSVESYHCVRQASGVRTLISEKFLQTRYGVGAPEGAAGAAPEAGAKLSSSPVIKAESDADYDAANLADADPTTAWCPVAKTGGRVSWTFDLPTSFSRLLIANGYQRTSARGTDLFAANARVKEVLLTNDRGEKLRLTLRDAKGTLEYALPESSFGADVRSVKLEVLSAYPGTKYQDVLLSEVIFR